MPSWIPGYVALAYVVGSVLIASGLSMLVNWKARLAATWLGIAVFVLLVYLPIVVARPSDIDGLNYLSDTLAFSGSALLLAGGLAKGEELAGMKRTVLLAPKSATPHG